MATYRILRLFDVTATQRAEVDFPNDAAALAYMATLSAHEIAGTPHSNVDLEHARIEIEDDAEQSRVRFWLDRMEAGQMEEEIEYFDCPQAHERVEYAARDILAALKLCVIRDPSLKANVMVMQAIARAEGREDDAPDTPPAAPHTSETLAALENAEAFILDCPASTHRDAVLRDVRGAISATPQTPDASALMLAALKAAPDMATFWTVDGFGVAREFDRTGYVIAYSNWKKARDAAISAAEGHEVRS